VCDEKGIAMKLSAEAPKKYFGILQIAF